MRLVAVTGGMATGKSTACRLLAETLGCPSCSCDEMVHRMLATEPVIRAVGERFPGTVDSTGTIDRAKLADAVFHAPQERRALEEILHPLVLGGVREWAAARQSEARIGVVEVPLLYEVDFPIERDVVLVVACSEPTQLRRLALRGGGSSRAKDRLAAQMPISEKMARSDLVIWNEGSLGTLTRLVALAASRIHQKTQ
ncbi:MAG: dephospho-CoA kinase [Verrucomicrobia bacterium]|nr:dephospho-CoA kinase [Verrucomicrobiota bacterium]